MMYIEFVRGAAVKLGQELEPNIPALVEAHLQTGRKTVERYDLATSIALAALVLQATQFVWDIYQDKKSKSKDAIDQDALARQMRIHLNIVNGISVEKRDRIITLVIEEANKIQEIEHVIKK